MVGEVLEGNLFVLIESLYSQQYSIRSILTPNFPSKGGVYENNVWNELFVYEVINILRIKHVLNKSSSIIMEIVLHPVRIMIVDRIDILSYF